MEIVPPMMYKHDPDQPSYSGYVSLGAQAGANIITASNNHAFGIAVPFRYRLLGWLRGECTLRGEIKHKPHPWRPRYFVTDGEYPFVRTEHEVMTTCYGGTVNCAMQRYTVVVPDELIGYVVHVGGRGASSFCLDRLHDLLKRQPFERCPK
jgi:hypothetical protein